MKPLSFSNVLTLLLSIAAPILTSEVAISSPPIDRDRVVNVQPFNLVHLAYQGYFQDEGIPGYGAFRIKIEQKQVTAPKLIEIAIEKGRLSPDALSNQDYVHAVKTQLQLIVER